MNAALFLISFRNGLFQDSSQNDPGKVLGRLFVRDVQQPSGLVPEDIVQRMVYEHSEECSHHDPRFDLTHRAFLLALTNVFADKSIDLRYKLTKETVSQLVLFQSGVEQEPHERDVLLVIGHRLQRDVVENRKVVAVSDSLLENLISFPGKLVKSVLARFALQ